MTDHAKLSPSSANRWVVCQESLQPVPDALKVGRDPDDDGFARDGSAKHALSEWCLQTGNDVTDALLEEMVFHGLHTTTDIAEAADIYVQHVRGLLESDQTLLYHWFEERVYIEDVDEDMFGTLDCALYSEHKKHLIIGDAKFGWEVKEAEGNWQLRAYAIGKVSELEDLGFEVEKITCFICQPPDTFQPVKSVDYTREQLKHFAKQMKRAKSGNVAKAGDHCNRCPRAHFCETLDNFVKGLIEETDQGKMPDVITGKTPEEVAFILNNEETYQAWFKGVKQWARQLIIMRQDVPGWELYQGKSNRQYRDITQAENVLHAEFGDGIYEPRQLRSPAQVEKVFGKPAKELMNGTEEKQGLTERFPTAQQLRKVKKC